MREPNRVPVRLKDYTPPRFLVDSVEMTFHLKAKKTKVYTKLHLRRNPDGDGGSELVLDGIGLKLKHLAIDGRELGKDDYHLDDEHLTIDPVPDSFVLETRVRNRPARNTELQGLYKAGSSLLTQCEAEGFRRITFFPDRPDVMSRYDVTLIADAKDYPVLLANGNPVDAGSMSKGRHFARWEDPFPKSCYLFALVAGQLDYLEDFHTTPSGRKVTLRIYAEPENIPRCRHAMDCLIQSMVWDEQRYGLECDLDHYNVVATNDFNMGAMENKGLNIFNAVYVLASAETATDGDFLGIQGVIGHEYFHNWTGNRVTCRDWFQLSLKEGLTVYRDQEFSSDLGSRAVKRIEDVRRLRTSQFAEDAGPMAHPVRPDAYLEIDNFYTRTVYEKGAEVVRMYETLLGREGFRRGMDLYFERHDGQAVTCDDFRAAMADANDCNLDLFERWYSQAGTPELRVTMSHDADAATCALTLHQHSAESADGSPKEPQHIPVRMALLDPAGQALPLRHWDESEPAGLERVIELTEREQTFVFCDVHERPVPSLLRGFSAPVKLDFEYNDAELGLLMARDSDSFVRWDAAQTLATRIILARVEDGRAGRLGEPPRAFVEACRSMLSDFSLDPALVAEAMTLPDEGYLATLASPVDVDGLHLARGNLRRAVAGELFELLLGVYAANRDSGPYSVEPAAIARRSLRNVVMAYLLSTCDERAFALAERQYRAAGNMTDSLAALTGLVHNGAPVAEELLEDFYQRWQTNPLVLNKWFALQAMSPRSDVVEKVQQLVEHADFTLKNPNRVRSVVAAFALSNPIGFHQAGGLGYQFAADQIIAVDSINSHMAARMAGCFNRWRHYDDKRSREQRAQLERILAIEGLSKATYEIVSKALES